MFWEMSNNDTLPNNAPLPPKWPPTSKFEWTLAFIFLNLIAAGYYYFTEYRKD